LIKSTTTTTSSSSSKLTISDDQASADISVHTIKELKMSINMKMHSNNNFLTRIDLYYRGNRVDLAKIDEKWISLLIVEYYNLVNNLNKSIIIDHKSKKKEIPNHKQLIGIINNMIRILRTARSIFRHAHVLNIDTEDGFRDIIFARTRIELDADILTILSPDFLIISRANSFLVLHNLNVNLANNLFRRRLYNLFNSIKNLIDTARIVAILVWLSISLYALSGTFTEVIRNIVNGNIVNGNIDTQSYVQLIVLILDLVGGPYVLLRFLPNIIGRIILHKIRKELHF
jgi:hypothetical protein